MNDFVSHIDILPTILAAAGVSKDHERNVDGVNLLPYIFSAQQCDSDGVHQTVSDSSASSSLPSGSCMSARQRRYHIFEQPLVINNDAGNSGEESHKRPHETLFWRSSHYMAVRVPGYKLQLAGNPRKMWLHDMIADPTERVNLAERPEYQDKVQELLKILHALNASAVQPLWPAVTEVAISIDKFYESPLENATDEYVYWAN